MVWGYMKPTGNHASTCEDNSFTEFHFAHQEFLDDSAAVNASKTSGMFLPACLEHCMSLNDTLWTKIKVGGMTAGEAISKWFFGSGPLHLIDCSWPCNPTCPDKKFG